MIMAAVGIGMQAVASYNEEKLAQSQAKISGYQYDVDTALAKMSSNNTTLNLTKQFNNTMASNAVVAAAQGRSGGSVDAIASAAKKGYNWDIDFSELSRDIQTEGLTAMSLSSSRAEEIHSNAAVTNMLGTIASGATKLYSIGGSTNKGTV